jgi:hypothetical protein
MNQNLRIFTYAWAAPASTIGLIATTIAVWLGATCRVVDGVLEVAGGRLASVVPVLPGCCHLEAITFGHVVIGLDHADLCHHRSHEHVHVRQYERWGILFFPLYLGSSLLQLLRGRDPYLDNRFEREAFSRADARG